MRYLKPMPMAKMTNTKTTVRIKPTMVGSSKIKTVILGLNFSKEIQTIGNFMGLIFRLRIRFNHDIFDIFWMFFNNTHPHFWLFKVR